MDLSVPCIYKGSWCCINIASTKQSSCLQQETLACVQGCNCFNKVNIQVDLVKLTSFDNLSKSHVTLINVYASIELHAVCMVVCFVSGF